MRVVAVIPAYNEELTIGSMILKAKRHVDRVIVVDDGSGDATAEVAELAGAEVIRLKKNYGKAHALMRGFERARDLNPRAVVMLDADGQHDPEEIPLIVAPVLKGEADLLIGSRFLNNHSRIPKYRMFGQKILNIFTNLSSNHKTTDSQSGFRALSIRALENIDFDSDGYSIESYMIAHFSSRGLKIKEVPISVNYDVPKKHKNNPFVHGITVLNDLVSLVGYRRPLLSFGVPGIIAVILGLGFGFWAFSDFYNNGRLTYGPSIASVLFLVLGTLSIISGLILNSLVQIMRGYRKK